MQALLIVVGCFLAIGAAAVVNAEYMLADHVFSLGVKTAVKKACPSLLSKDLPNEIFANSTNTKNKISVKLNFAPLKLLSLQDFGESMTISARFALSWNIPTCNSIDCASVGQGNFCDASKYEFTSSPDEIWHPKLRHVNAIANKEPFKTLKNEIVTTVLGGAMGARNVSGDFAMKCGSFKFHRYPFEYYTCNMILEADDWAGMVEYSASVTQTDSNALAGTYSIWRLDKNIEMKTEVLPQFVDGKQGKTRITFSMTFQRKYAYSLIILFIPFWCMLAIAICIFPVIKKERIALIEHDALAFIVIVCFEGSFLPKSGEMTYTSIMHAGHFVFCCFFTAYMIVSQAIEETLWMKSMPKIGGRTPMRLVDIIVFAVSTALTIILDIILFCLMNGSEDYDSDLNNSLY